MIQTVRCPWGCPTAHLTLLATSVGGPRNITSKKREKGNREIPSVLHFLFICSLVHSPSGENGSLRETAGSLQAPLLPGTRHRLLGERTASPGVHGRQLGRKCSRISSSCTATRTGIERGTAIRLAEPCVHGACLEGVQPGHGTMWRHGRWSVPGLSLETPPHAMVVQVAVPPNVHLLVLKLVLLLLLLVQWRRRKGRETVTLIVWTRVRRRGGQWTKVWLR